MNFKKLIVPFLVLAMLLIAMTANNAAAGPEWASVVTESGQIIKDQPGTFQLHIATDGENLLVGTDYTLDSATNAGKNLTFVSFVEQGQTVPTNVIAGPFKTGDVVLCKLTHFGVGIGEENLGVSQLLFHLHVALIEAHEPVESAVLFEKTRIVGIPFHDLGVNDEGADFFVAVL